MRAFALESVACLALALVACGGEPKKPVESAENDGEDRRTGGMSESADKPAPTSTAAASEDAPKKDECIGFEIDDLEALLNKAACEVKSGGEAKDLKGKLEIRVAPMPPHAKGGEKVDVIVMFVNKTKETLPLFFTIDPTPRFEIEVYDAKNKRVDMPAGNPPPPPKGVSVPPAAEAKTARVTLAANGTAKVHVPYVAAKMKWAPEKVRSTPPERGYPRAPSGPLGKGKYSLRVVTPLAFVVEGMDKEISAPKAPFQVE